MASSREPPVTTPCGSMTSPSSVTMVLRVSRVPPQLESLGQVLDHHDISEQVGRDFVVMTVETDELEHGASYAIATGQSGLRPERRLRRHRPTRPCLAAATVPPGRHK